MQHKVKKLVVMGMVLLFGSLLGGCATIKLNPNASKVIASPNQPPKSCHYLGQVTGSQGNFISGEFTSNKSLDSGAQNDLKNQAAVKGGNYIQLITVKTSNFGSIGRFGGSMEQTGATAIGNVYHCPPSSIGE